MINECYNLKTERSASSNLLFSVSENVYIVLVLVGTASGHWKSAGPRTHVYDQLPALAHFSARTQTRCILLQGLMKNKLTENLNLWRERKTDLDDWTECKWDSASSCQSTEFRPREILIRVERGHASEISKRQKWLGWREYLDYTLTPVCLLIRHGRSYS